VIRECDGTDPSLRAGDKASPCACGALFDDVYYSTCWPHDPVGPARLDWLLRARPPEPPSSSVR
jgi:hypothetical protein